MLDKLNTKAVGAVGLIAGTGTVVGAVAALFKLLSSPDYVTNLLYASADLDAAFHGKGHLTPSDVTTYAQLIAACMGVVGAVIVSLVAANIGKSVFKNYKNSAGDGGDASGGASSASSAGNNK